MICPTYSIRKQMSVMLFICHQSFTSKRVSCLYCVSIYLLFARINVTIFFGPKTGWISHIYNIMKVMQWQLLTTIFNSYKHKNNETTADTDTSINIYLQRT